MPVNDTFLKLGEPHYDSAFVGRKRELFKLGSALERARSGSGSVFLLSGEAGVGKTCLATEFAEFARSSGAKVLEGRANPRFRETLPFGVWKQIFSSRLSYDGAEKVDQLGTGSPVRFPTLAVLRPGAAGEPATKMLETAVRTLIDDAQIQPLILVLDDLHAADPQSLDAFRVFARQLSRFGTVVVGIYRDSEIRRFREFAELLTDPIARDSEHILLQGFDDFEIRQFVRSRLARAVDEAALESLLRLTDGNPRLLDFALRLNLQATASLPLSGENRRLMSSEIESHLESMAPALRRILVAGSVIGAQFELSVLARVSNHSPIELLDALADAEREGFVRKERPGLYRFRQTLLREALYEELSGAARAHLHLRIGGVLEDLYSHEDAYLGRIARHFFEAALVGGVNKAAEYCRRAAELADLNGQLKEASELYEMAISALELQGRPGSSMHSELRLKLKGLIGQAERNVEGGRDALRAGRTENAQFADAASEPSASQRSTPGLKFSLPAAAMSRLDDSPVPQTGDGALGGEPRNGHPPDLARSEDNSESRARERQRAVREPSTPTGDERICRREGDFWTLKFAEKTIRVKGCHGLTHLAHLLQHPAREFHVIQLAGVLGGANPPESHFLSRADRQNLSVRSSLYRDTDPVLDVAAKTSYRHRIEALRHEIEEARSFNDLARGAKLEEELDTIEAELIRAVGVRGLDRRHSSESERARVNVTNAIRSLVKRIRSHHPALARYLSNTIKTGYYCSYNPEPNNSPTWQVSL